MAWKAAALLQALVKAALSPVSVLLNVQWRWSEMC